MITFQWHLYILSILVLGLQVSSLGVYFKLREYQDIPIERQFYLIVHPSFPHYSYLLMNASATLLALLYHYFMRQHFSLLVVLLSMLLWIFEFPSYCLVPILIFIGFITLSLLSQRAQKADKTLKKIPSNTRFILHCLVHFHLLVAYLIPAITYYINVNSNLYVFSILYFSVSAIISGLHYIQIILFAGINGVNDMFYRLEINLLLPCISLICISVIPDGPYMDELIPNKQFRIKTSSFTKILASAIVYLVVILIQLYYIIKCHYIKRLEIRSTRRRIVKVQNDLVKGKSRVRFRDTNSIIEPSESIGNQSQVNQLQSIEGVGKSISTDLSFVSSVSCNQGNNESNTTTTTTTSVQITQGSSSEE